MRDPLKEPKYGDVFAWSLNGHPEREEIVVYLTSHRSSLSLTWVGMEVVAGKTAPRIPLHQRDGRWRVVKAAP